MPPAPLAGDSIGTSPANPYERWAGKPPRFLAGRGEHLTLIDEALGQLRLGGDTPSLVLIGERGMGKSVLLREAHILAQEAALACEEIEVTPVAGAGSDQIEDALARLAHQVKPRRLSRYLNRVTSVGTDVSVGVPPVKVQVRGSLAQKAAKDRVTAMAERLVQVGEAARGKGRGAVLFVDEAQRCDELSLQGLLMGLHAAATRDLPVAVVAAGLPPVQAAIRTAMTYGERLLRYSRVGALSPNDAGDALRQPARLWGVEFEPEALGLLVHSAQGYPFYLQLFGFFTWEHRDRRVSRISLDEARSGERAAHDYLASHRYEPILNQLTASEALFLREMAARPDTPQDRRDLSSAALAKGAGVVGVTEVRLAAGRLITKSILSVHPGDRVDFAVPGLRDYMIRSGWAD